MPLVEGCKTFADLGSATDTLAHECHAVDCAGGVFFAERIRDMNEAGVEEKRIGLPKCIKDTVHETDEHRGIEAHRARCIQQDNKFKRLVFSLAVNKFKRHAARRDAAMDGPPQIKSRARTAHFFAPGQPSPHAA